MQNAGCKDQGIGLPQQVQLILMTEENPVEGLCYLLFCHLPTAACIKKKGILYCAFVDMLMAT